MNTSTDIHHEDEHYEKKILCRKLLEYLAEPTTEMIDVLPTENDFTKKYLNAEQFDIWNGPIGTFGGIRTLGDMRFLIRNVLINKKFIQNVKRATYICKITKVGRDFIKKQIADQDIELDRILDDCAKFYKVFFSPEITKGEFKEFIEKWSNYETIKKKKIENENIENEKIDDNGVRIRNNAKRVIYEIYKNPFLPEKCPDITNFGTALGKNFQSSFGASIATHLKREIKYSTWAIDLCLKSRYEFNDNFKAALEELNKDGTINLEEWGKWKIKFDKSDTENNENEMENKKVNIQDNIKALLIANHNLVLTGAPGTGKTYLANKVAELLVGEEKEKTGAQGSPAEQEPPKNFCQFHPSFDYTDFVEGLRPVKSENNQIGFERKDGIFKSFCKEAVKHPDKNYVFIIDEINRGDISKIFGELFYAIDPGYRGENGIVKTQYNNLIDSDDDEFKKGFYVPENVYIIGTMNDIDRSVESMDFAIRRRFLWKKILPEDQMEMLDLLDEAPANNAEAIGEDSANDAEAIDEAPANEAEVIDEAPANNAESLAETAKAKMNALNKVISASPELGEDYQIGPAYFLKLRNLKNDFEQLWIMNLEPLLREYLRGRTKEDIDENIKNFRTEYEKAGNNGNTEQTTGQNDSDKGKDQEEQS